MPKKFFNKSLSNLFKRKFKKPLSDKNVTAQNAQSDTSGKDSNEPKISEKDIIELIKNINNSPTNEINLMYINFSLIQLLGIEAKKYEKIFEETQEKSLEKFKSQGTKQRLTYLPAAFQIVIREVYKYMNQLSHLNEALTEASVAVNSSIKTDIKNGALGALLKSQLENESDDVTQHDRKQKIYSSFCLGVHCLTEISQDKDWSEFINKLDSSDKTILDKNKKNRIKRDEILKKIKNEHPVAKDVAKTILDVVFPQHNLGTSFDEELKREIDGFTKGIEPDEMDHHLGQTLLDNIKANDDTKDKFKTWCEVLGKTEEEAILLFNKRLRVMIQKGAQGDVTELLPDAMAIPQKIQVLHNLKKLREAENAKLNKLTMIVKKITNKEPSPIEVQKYVENWINSVFKSETVDFVRGQVLLDEISEKDTSPSLVGKVGRALDMAGWTAVSWFFMGGLGVAASGIRFSGATLRKKGFGRFGKETFQDFVKNQQNGRSITPKNA